MKNCISHCRKQITGFGLSPFFIESFSFTVVKWQSWKGRGAGLIFPTKIFPVKGICLGAAYHCTASDLFWGQCCWSAISKACPVGECDEVFG